MIKFKKIKYKNLLSSGNYFTEINLDTNTNTLVVGMNGSGKSTMLDALCFVLFGKAFRNINKSQLINSINEKECRVEIFFESNDKSYQVVRGMKPNVFEIYEDGTLLNQEASVRDYQEVLEKFILKLNYKSFTQIVILGSASFVPFMQLSASDRRSIIEDLLDIQIFSTMNSVVKDKMSNLKDLTFHKKSEIDLLKQRYELLKKHNDEKSLNSKEKIDEYRKTIQTKKQEIKKLTEENDIFTLKINELNSQLSSKPSVDNLIKKMTKLESQIETNLKKHEKDIEFFCENDTCPTCRQSIDAELKQQEIAMLSEKKDQSKEGLKQIDKKIKEQQSKLKALFDIEKEIQKTQINLATNKQAIIETNKFIEQIENEILKIESTQKNNDDTEIISIKNDLFLTQKELKELIEQKSYYETASVLLKDTGIKTKIIKQYLPIINKLVNKYLTALDFFVNFTLDESFKEVIKSRHRDEFAYNNFSEGEKQKIDMALMLTWRAIAKLKNSSNTNLLILDEVFDSSLDANGTEYLMSVLQMLEDVNLFVISHKGDILQDKFANTIRFEKVKNFSRMIK